ncbi:MAG: RluA family pseudouridine synthase [Pseudomonadota bacterium]
MAAPDPDGARHRVSIAGTQAGARLDKALTEAAEAAGLALSRSRIGQLIASGAVLAPNGQQVTEPARKVKAGEEYCLNLPPPRAAVPQPEAMDLDIRHEDADLLVVNKPAGLVVHPASGTPDGTLVNGLLAHCGPGLTGIGGEARPGIVHRIDKDTSGLLVVAKTQTAMTGLAAQFAAHTIERRYTAVLWGAPDRADPRLAGRPDVSFAADGTVRIEAPIGRGEADRTRMAVRPDGRGAVTHLAVQEAFGPSEKPFASLAEARLETGRTHQIRVHTAHIGHPLVGDQTYGRPRRIAQSSAGTETRRLIETFPRQALHAAVLGFEHPVSGEFLRFSAELPPDLHDLLTSLRRIV